MAAALPANAAVKPKQPRRVLILNKCNGFVTSSIPLATTMIQMIGDKTGAWSADASWDSDVINAENLKKYDVILLNSTTGAYLDDPNDPAVTAARRQALLDFVRGGKGIVGLHGAVDAYRAQTPRAAGGCAVPRWSRSSRGRWSPAGPRRRSSSSRRGGAAPPTPTQPVSSWPEFTKMMNGLFKYHWVNQLCHRQDRRPEEPDQRVVQGSAVRDHR